MNDYAKEWDRMAKEDAKTAILNPGRKITDEEFEASGKGDAELVAEFIYPNPSSLVLDLFCGIGRVMKHASSNYRTIIGLDGSNEMLSVAKLYCPVNHLKKCSFVHCDWFDLPFPDAAFDGCYSLLGLQHVDKHHAMKYILEIARVLKPRGRCVVGLPNIMAKCYGEEFLRLSTNPETLEPHRVRPWYPREAERCFDLAGFITCIIHDDHDNFIVYGVKPS